MLVIVNPLEVRVAFPFFETDPIIYYLGNRAIVSIGIIGYVSIGIIYGPKLSIV